MIIIDIIRQPLLQHCRGYSYLYIATYRYGYKTVIVAITLSNNYFDLLKNKSNLLLKCIYFKLLILVWVFFLI